MWLIKDDVFSSGYSTMLSAITGVIRQDDIKRHVIRSLDKLVITWPFSQTSEYDLPRQHVCLTIMKINAIKFKKKPSTNEIWIKHRIKMKEVSLTIMEIYWNLTTTYKDGRTTFLYPVYSDPKPITLYS